MIKKIIEGLVVFYLSSPLTQAIILVVLLSVLAGGVLLVTLFVRRQRTSQVLKHLNEAEKQVFTILHRKGGSCYQSTLAYVSNIPKSSLSELISELEERNIIKKRKKGNKNIISLKY